MASFRKEQLFSLINSYTEGYTDQELENEFQNCLRGGMHGICFSPYETGQKPGDQLNIETINRRMNIIAPHTKWVRSFSTTEGNEHIPKLAKEKGLKTLVGTWISDDLEKNKIEIKNLVDLCKQGLVDIAAVGNEVLYRKEMSEDELIQCIKDVKKQVGDIPVGYVDAYYEFHNRPKITEVCDVILANCYPYWEGCELEYSLLYMKEMFMKAKRAAGDKKVIITETGWPNKGTRLGGALPSHSNTIKYFINAQKWSKEDDIEMFYFTSFDEEWKISNEGDVGAFWGIWDKNERLKF